MRTELKEVWYLNISVTIPGIFAIVERVNKAGEQALKH